MRCRAIATLLTAVLALTSCASPPPSAPDIPLPQPEISFFDVVEIQLDALARSGDVDFGIATLYSFISPDSRESLGSLSDFSRLLSDSRFDPLRHPYRLQFAGSGRWGSLAYQSILITDARGFDHRYVFVLRRQSEEPYAGCWLISDIQVENYLNDVVTERQSPPGAEDI